MKKSRAALADRKALSKANARRLNGDLPKVFGFPLMH